MTRRIPLTLLLALLVVVFVPAVSPVSAQETLFTKTDGFATKTGFRFVFSWEAKQPVSVTIQFGTDPSNLNRTATAFPDSGIPDTAGLAISDDRALVGRTIYWRAVDDLTGQASEIESFVAKNAYTDWDPVDETYTINLLVTLDTESLPEDIPHDLALDNIADGMNIFAETFTTQWTAMPASARF